MPNRIISLNKPHIRPISIGTETKTIEFATKVNNILVDGISFIEKLSFNAFNEGTRLVHCLKMHKRLFGGDAKKVGGDAGYAGTENRDYCKENGIQTSFVKTRPSILRGEEGERPCQAGTCQSEGDSDGGIVRYAERAL